MSMIVGLTGGIATGKSTISEMFRNENIPVIDADTIAREVVNKNEPAYLKIIQEFGPQILLVTGDINRKKLAQIIFNDEKKRDKLNTIVHPEVKKRIVNEIKLHETMGSQLVVLDVPLLYESNFQEMCDFVVVVFTDESTQLQRLMKRDNLSLEEAKKRIASQMSLRDKIELADFKIDNSLSILETKTQFTMLMKKLNRI